MRSLADRMAHPIGLGISVSRYTHALSALGISRVLGINLRRPFLRKSTRWPGGSTFALPASFPVP